MEDTELTCGACGKAYVFSASEQAYYAERGFQLPKRCRTCRQQRRKSGRGPAVGSPSGSVAALPKRPVRRRKLFPVSCAECARDHELAFPPDETPVYCAECFRGRHSA